MLLLEDIQFLFWSFLFLGILVYNLTCLWLEISIQLFLFHLFPIFCFSVCFYRLSDNKSPQVSRTRLSILADLNNALVWTFSKSSSLFINPLLTVPKAQITIGIIITFMFHNFFFNSLAKDRDTYPNFHFQFYFMVSRDSKVFNSASSHFFCVDHWPNK